MDQLVQATQSDDLEDVHSCSICPRIEMPPRNDKPSFSVTVAEVDRRAELGCKFFLQQQKYLNQIPPSLGPVLPQSYFNIVVTKWDDDPRWIIECNWEHEDYTLTSMVFALESKLPNANALCPENIRRLKRWIKRCSGKHRGCTNPEGAALPMLLIDLADEEREIVRLFETKGTLAEAASYVALSYCWGSDPKTTQEQKTVKANLGERMTGFPLSTLPRTVRDAVSVCGILGFRYLWVDAFCNVQDAETFGLEMDRMTEIYLGASLVISASSASCADEGFLGPRPRAYAQYDLLVSDPDTRGEGRVRVAEQIPGDKREPIDTRGWTFQEHRYARRILRFETEELTYWCRNTDGRESDIRGHAQRDYFSDPVKAYLQDVEDYSERATGRLEDRLKAFEGPPRRLGELMKWDKSNYKAGLWLTDLARQLLWQRDKYRPGFSADTERPSPSWSWGTRMMPVTWLDGMQNYLWTDYSCTVQDCSTELMDESLPYGSVKGGVLTVRGYARDAQWTGLEVTEISVRRNPVRHSSRLARNGRPGTRGTYGGPRTRHPQGHCAVQPRTLPFRIIWDDPVEPPPMKARFLEIRSGIRNGNKAYGLVLGRVGVRLFRRLGYFVFEHQTVELKTGEKVISSNWFREIGMKLIRIK